MSETEETRNLGYGRFAGRYLQVLGVLLLLWIPVNAVLNDAFTLDLTGLILLWFGWRILQGRNGYRIAIIILCSLSIGAAAGALLGFVCTGTSPPTATFFVKVEDPSMTLVAVTMVLATAVFAVPLVALLHPRTRKAFGCRLRPRTEFVISLVPMLVFAVALSALIVTTQRRKAAEPQVTLTLRWQERGPGSRPGKHWVIGSSTGFMDASADAPFDWSDSWDTVIDGQEYEGVVLKRETDESGTQTVVDYCYRPLNPTESAIDIRITKKVPVRFEVTDVSGVRVLLRNVETEEDLTSPFLLDPGEHHLQATRAEPENGE